jgi:hypothetical protein
MFRRIVLLAAVAVLAAAASSTAQAGTPATVSVTPFVGLVSNPCNGHYIDISGNIRSVYRAGGGGPIVSTSVIAGLKAVDPATGETYVLNQVFTYVLNIYTAGSGYEITWQISGVFVGGSSSFRSTGRLHATVTPEGVTTTSFETYEGRCM